MGVVAGALGVAACGLVLGLVEVADPVLVLLEEVVLDPVLVDPGPGLVLSLVPALAGALVVATGGLGPGLAEAAVPVLGPVSPDLVLAPLVLGDDVCEQGLVLESAKLVLVSPVHDDGLVHDGVVEPFVFEVEAAEPDVLDAGVVAPDVLVDGAAEPYAAAPILVLLVEVGLAPVLVDPGPGLVLSLVEAVTGALIVTACGLGIGLVHDGVVELVVLEVGAAEPAVLGDGAGKPDVLGDGAAEPEVLDDSVVERMFL